MSRHLSSLGAEPQKSHSYYDSKVTLEPIAEEEMDNLKIESRQVMDMGEVVRDNIKLGLIG